MDIAWTKNGVAVLTTVLVAVVTYAFYKIFSLLIYIRKVNQRFKHLPGPERHWLYGNMHHLMRLKFSHERIELGRTWCSMYPKFYVFWNGPAKPSITVSHPESVKTVMKTSEPKPTGYFGVYRLGLPWLGEGLLIAGGERWARSRRLLTPAFHFDILKPYIQVYNNATEILMKNLEAFADNGKTFEVFQYISPCTLDIILRCAFSYHTDCQNLKGDIHPYVKAVMEISETWSHRARNLPLYPDWIFYRTQRGRQFKRDCDYVHKVAEDIINSRRQVLESSEPSDRKYLDFLDILLKAKDENGVGLTQLEIRNEVDTFLFEGHDTTASATSWILYSLSTHPECQRKCQDEIDALLADRDTDEIQWSDLPKLEYLTMCIKEGMRLHSPVPVVQREFTQDFTIEDTTFPKGTTVTLHIYGLHNNRSVWENPDEYNPERFSRENISKIDTFQFVPFSAGPRNCIGQNFALNEEKVVLSRLLRKYTFEADPNHTVRKKIAAVTRAEDGIMMFVKRRKMVD